MTFPYVVMPYVTDDTVARALYAIWVFVLFFCLSANFVVVAGAVTRIYGPANMATIYGLIYMATVSGSPQLRYHELLAFKS